MEDDIRNIMDTLSDPEIKSEEGNPGSDKCHLCGSSYPDIESLLEHKKKVHFKIKECKVILTRVKLKEETSGTKKKDVVVQSSPIAKKNEEPKVENFIDTFKEYNCCSYSCNSHSLRIS